MAGSCGPACPCFIAGALGGRDCGVCTTAQAILSQPSALDAERAAIGDDAGLQDRIVLRAEAALKALRTAAAGGRGAVSPPLENYMDAATALFLMGALPGGAQRAARGSAHFAEEVMAVAELFLRLDPPPEVPLQRQQQVFCGAVYALDGICLTIAERGGRGPGFKATLRCLTLALALVDRIRQVEGEGFLLASAASGLHSILELLVTVYGLDSGGSFPPCSALLSEQHRAVEGMLRLAALLPPNIPGPHDANTTDPLADRFFDKLQVVFAALWSTLTSEVDGHKTWSSFAEVASSAAKLALLAEAGSSEKQADCLQFMVEKVGSVFKLSLLDEKSEGFSKR